MITCRCVEPFLTIGKDDFALHFNSSWDLCTLKNIAKYHDDISLIKKIRKKMIVSDSEMPDTIEHV